MVQFRNGSSDHSVCFQWTFHYVSTQQFVGLLFVFFLFRSLKFRSHRWSFAHCYRTNHIRMDRRITRLRVVSKHCSPWFTVLSLSQILSSSKGKHGSLPLWSVQKWLVWRRPCSEHPNLVKICYQTKMRKFDKPRRGQLERGLLRHRKVLKKSYSVRELLKIRILTRELSSKKCSVRASQ